MIHLSDKGVYLPPSPIRKLVPFAEAAKARGIKVYHLNIGQPDIETPREAIEAVRNIGDKVFEHESHFTYIYDLAAAWQELTGLPFVFAAWVAPRQTDALVIDALEKALAYGVGHVDEAIAESSYADRPYTHDYLTRNIDFRLDPSKRQAMELFRQKILEAEPPADPG